MLLLLGGIVGIQQIDAIPVRRLLNKTSIPEPMPTEGSDARGQEKAQLRRFHDHLPHEWSGVERQDQQQNQEPERRALDDERCLCWKQSRQEAQIKCHQGDSNQREELQRRQWLGSISQDRKSVV